MYKHVQNNMLIVVPHLEANTTFNKYWVGGVMFVCSSRVQYIMSSSPDLVKLKTGTYSVGNHFFQTLAKMASGLKLLLAKMKKSLPCLARDIFFKLANKYQINNTVMFYNLFCRFWQVINLVKKDQHSLKTCVDLFFLNFVVFVF